MYVLGHSALFLCTLKIKIASDRSWPQWEKIPNFLLFVNPFSVTILNPLSVSSKRVNDIVTVVIPKHRRGCACWSFQHGSHFLFDREIELWIWPFLSYKSACHIVTVILTVFQGTDFVRFLARDIHWRSLFCGIKKSTFAAICLQIPKWPQLIDQYTILVLFRFWYVKLLHPE